MRYRAALGDREIVDIQLPYHARVEATGLLAAGDAPAAQRLLVEAAEKCEDMPHFGIELRHHALRAGAPARSSSARSNGSERVATREPPPRTSTTSPRAPPVTALSSCA